MYKGLNACNREWYSAYSSVSIQLILLLATINIIFIHWKSTDILNNDYRKIRIQWYGKISNALLSEKQVEKQLV